MVFRYFVCIRLPDGLLLMILLKAEEMLYFQVCGFIIFHLLLFSVRLATTSPGNEEELISFLTSQLLHRDSDTLTSQLIAKSPARPTLNAVYERLFRIAKETLKR